VDVIKTRMMSQQRQTRISVRDHDASSVRYYHSSIDALRQILREEGMQGLYRGWLPNWIRIGPHTMIALVLFEELRKFARLPPM
jgi:hypothetical protein